MTDSIQSTSGKTADAEMKRLRQKKLPVVASIAFGVFALASCGPIPPKPVENQDRDTDKDTATEEQEVDTQQQQVCFCTDQKTNIECEPCDNEPNVSICFHHDQECQASAKQAGEKDPKQFFCTTHPAPSE